MKKRIMTILVALTCAIVLCSCTLDEKSEMEQVNQQEVSFEYSNFELTQMAQAMLLYAGEDEQGLEVMATLINNRFKDQYNNAHSLGEVVQKTLVFNDELDGVARKREVSDLVLDIARKALEKESNGLYYADYKKDTRNPWILATEYDIFKITEVSVSLTPAEMEVLLEAWHNGEELNYVMERYRKN